MWALLLPVVLSPATSSVHVEGEWHGRMVYDLTKLPKDLQPFQRQHLADEAKSRAADRLTLVLKTDHKFVETVSGHEKAPPLVGRWYQYPGSIVLQPIKNGMPQTPLTHTLSKDGKHLKYSAGPVTYLYWR